MPRPSNPQTREKLVMAAEMLILKHGYAGTSVDAICDLAGVTKGGFFHYFDTKQQVAIEAARQFHGNLKQAIANAPYHTFRDPARRVFGYLDFMIEFSQTDQARQGCLLGNLAQELAATDNDVRSVCQQCFGEWAQSLRADLTAARSQHSPRARWDPQTLADHFVATIEGAILLAKANRDIGVLAGSLRHLKQYLKLLLES